MKAPHRRARLALALLAAVVALAVAICLTRGFWWRQLHLYLTGSKYVAAEDYTVSLPAIDRVDVFLLGGMKKSVHKITSYDFDDFEVRQRTQCDAAQSQRLVALWRCVPGTYVPSFIALCHKPAYGLRFWHDGKLVFETTVCWKCGDFTVPTVLGRSAFPFDAKHPSSQKILEELRAILPDPENPAPAT